MLWRIINAYWLYTSFLWQYDELDNYLAIPNSVPFDCTICMDTCDVGVGMKLRECLHDFCKECLVGVVLHGDECEVKCPYVNANNENCDGIIQEREIQGILSQEQFEAYIQRTRRLSMNMITTAFPCRTVNCKGCWLVEEGDVDFECTLCQAVNCLACKVRNVYRALSKATKKI